MNQLNYASLEASKRLVKAGIVLETEAGWYKIFRPGSHAFDMVLSARSGNEKFYGDNFPAPSMTEVWRELPGTIETDDTIWNLLIGKNAGGGAYAMYVHRGHLVIKEHDTNPTDALIDLLIWVKERKP